MRHLILALLFCLLCPALLAQTGKPDVTVSGDTLFAPEAKSYQWYQDGVLIPGAVGRYYLPPVNGSYTVQMQSLTSVAMDFNISPTLVVTGQVLDDLMRPVADADLSIGDANGRTDASGRFFLTTARTRRLAVRARRTGWYNHTVAFLTTSADTQYVVIRLAPKTVTHRLLAATGGTVSQGGFWLTLQPSSVVTETGAPYSGDVNLSILARRPGDPDFADRMPGGDYMAVDRNGEQKILISYGFADVELMTADGAPLKLAPGATATLEYLIDEEQRPDAPTQMPLWYFDEAASVWKEDGVASRVGNVYRGDVRHFTPWNVDKPAPNGTLVSVRVKKCGRSGGGVPIYINDVITAYSDVNGVGLVAVPPGVKLNLRVGDLNTTVGPLITGQFLDMGQINVSATAPIKAFGVVDENSVLTMYTNCMECKADRIEYSLDSTHWQPGPSFKLNLHQWAKYGWARLPEYPDCPPVRVKLYWPLAFSNCQVFTQDLVNQKYVAYTIDKLLNADSALSRINLSSDNLQLWWAAARGQSCVQEVHIGVLPQNEAYEVNEVVDKLTRVWLNLRWFHISCGKLTIAPDALGDLAQLQRLDLSYNQLVTLPKSVGQLGQLQLLSLYRNKVTALPEELKYLPNLAHLNLGENNLRILPDFIGDIWRLDTLNVSGNSLKVLPDAIGNLSALTGLDARDNKLTTLPNSIANLAGTLKTLNLSGNPISPGEQARIRALLPNTQITF